MLHGRSDHGITKGPSSRSFCGSLIIFLLISFLGQCFPSGRSFAADWTTLVQPTGTLVTVLDPIQVNAYLAGKGYTNPPFDTGTRVTDIITTKELNFVRVYSPPGNAAGSWIMRASTIRGLTPAQIKVAFALPSLPTRIVYVAVPAGSTVYTGIAGPIPSWGNGGAQQSYLYYYIPRGSFEHDQPLGNRALLYAPALGDTGNAGRVAAYLDGLTPAPYSNLESVYSALDYLNYGDPAPLRAALNQIDPERYEAFTRIAIRNELLFGNAVAQRGSFSADPATTHAVDVDSGPCAPWGQRDLNIWFGGIGEFGSQADSGDHTGFAFNTGGIVFGMNILRYEKLVLGAATGYLGTNLDWNIGGGDAHLDNTQWGIYGQYGDSTGFFLDALTAGGYESGTANRNINFPQVDQVAHADIDGFDMTAQVRGGYTFRIADWSVSPVAALSYFLTSRDNFTETGADGLNLNVRFREGHTFRSRLGVKAGKQISINGMPAAPSLELAWAHEAPLDDRAIAAGLSGQPGSFTIYGLNGDIDSLVVNAGLRGQLTANTSLSTGYQAEIGDRFTSQQVDVRLVHTF
ncbi:MAG: autotransporter outer membrane beta-barrel domain-containing protein [Syntrophobacteraceae bacterium]